MEIVSIDGEDWIMNVSLDHQCEKCRIRNFIKSEVIEELMPTEDLTLRDKMFETVGKKKDLIDELRKKNGELIFMGRCPHPRINIKKRIKRRIMKQLIRIQPLFIRNQMIEITKRKSILMEELIDTVREREYEKCFVPTFDTPLLPIDL